MKIVLVCRVYPTHRPGGMPFVCQDRARELANQGHEVFVLTTSHPAYKTITDRHVNVLHLPGTPTQVYSREFAEACLEMCQSIKPSIVHLDSLDVNNPWWKDLDVKIKTAVTMHGFCWGAFLTSWNLFYLGINSKEKVNFNPEGFVKERNALSSFRTVIGISQHEYRMLRDLMFLSQTKLVYNPIPEYFFLDVTNKKPDKSAFLCASISGQDTRLFDTAAKVAKKINVELRIVSRRSRSEMPFIYDEATALIVPTAYSQGYDLTVAESLARRRRVITSSVGSYSLESENNEGISTFPLGDTKSLELKMQEVLDLPLPPEYLANVHRPNIAINKWLEAVT